MPIDSFARSCGKMWSGILIQVKQRITDTTTSKHSCVGSMRSLVSSRNCVESLSSAIRRFATSSMFPCLVVS
jgi:hypothetical protein